MRRRKPYKPKPVRTPLIVGAQLVFGPLQAIMDQLDLDGTVTTNAQGTAMFQDGDGNWYETSTALEGIIEHCDMWAARHNKALPTGSLAQLARFLRFGMNLPESLMQNLHHDIPRLQAAMARGNADDMVDLLNQVQIKVELEQAAIQP